MAITRDRQTGRFQHTWDYVGVTDKHEVGRCNCCGKYRLSGEGRDMVLTRAQFERRYPSLAETM